MSTQTPFPLIPSTNGADQADGATRRNPAQRFDNLDAPPANGAEDPCATRRNVAQRFDDFDPPAADGAEDPDRATPRNPAQRFFDSDAPAANDAENPDRATWRNAAQRFSGFEDPAASNGAADATELPPQSMEDEQPPDSKASLEEDAFPSYSSPPPCPEAADFKTPWDSDIQPWKAPELTEQQKTAIDLILCGKKLDKVATQLGIHRGTLWRWRRHDLDFRIALGRARAKAFQHAIEQLRELVPKAVDVVHSQLESDDHQAAFQLLRLVVKVDRDAVDPI